MRVFILLIPILTGMLIAAEQNPGAKGKRPVTKTAKATAPAAAPVKVPEGAVEIEPNLWRHTDEKGKTWHYRRTPFGVVKFEPEAQAEASAPPQDNGVTARLRGDTVELERSTPFGVRRWTKKKADLDDEEKAAVDRAAKVSAKE